MAGTSRSCCGISEPRDLGVAIIPVGDDGLAWRWSCSRCDKVLSVEPFAYPPDFPRE